MPVTGIEDDETTFGEAYNAALDVVFRDYDEAIAYVSSVPAK